MITKQTIVFDILNSIYSGKGGTSDDILISKRWLSYNADIVRAKLIREDIEKNRSVSANITQSLGCVDVVLTDATTCCEVPSGCTIYRTNVKIPKPIELYQRDLITRIGPAAIGEKGFQIIPYQRAPWASFGPIEALNGVPKAFLFNGYIYLIIKNKDKVIKKINIQGVFASPEDVKSFNTCDGEVCYSDETPYPISEHMLQPLKQILIENIKIAINGISDNQGDNKLNLEPNIEK